ncbi:unnamed protein product [Trichobilharzia regenti]|nr:unnamed protein product [Trichobilharzia regenti]
MSVFQVQPKANQSINNNNFCILIVGIINIISTHTLLLLSNVSICREANYPVYTCAVAGIRGLGRFYFEVTPIEATGLWRFGWSTDEGNLIIGTDNNGFGYGADNEGFGLNGQQGKRIHGDEIENYGEVGHILMITILFQN